ncbi:MAG: hypothetical protein JWM91_3107 [Rhodospirillales bacterium]|nr:hypothetical protein [Rhodospirillales bacterium]
MSVLLEVERIVLRGNCSVEDAEPLVVLLQTHPDFEVDIGDTLHLHSAVLQVLLAFRPRLAGPSQDAFIQTWIVPLLTSVDGRLVPHPRPPCE